MPELPEVQTITDELNSAIVGKIIKSVDVLDKKIFIGDVKDVENVDIVKIERRAKNIIIKLNNNYNLLIHLKLSGQLFYSKKGEKNQFVNLPDKYIRVIINFSDKSKLFFDDFRRFAYMKIVNNSILQKELEKFGPEPLEKKFTYEKFKEILSKKPRAKIKVFLMDQTNIAGIGNIYSDEILWLAKINPLRKIESLVENDKLTLFDSIKIILIRAVKFKGTSGKDEMYRRINGEIGGYKPELKVYQRTGLKCLRNDGGIITRQKINGRSAHYCPVCQK